VSRLDLKIAEFVPSFQTHVVVFSVRDMAISVKLAIVLQSVQPVVLKIMYTQEIRLVSFLLTVLTVVQVILRMIVAAQSGSLKKKYNI